MSATRRTWPILIALGALGAAPRADEVPERNRDVLEFARERLGERVGSGQCTSLAQEALRHAGARSRFDAPRPDADFAWGRLVATLTPKSRRTAEIRPGDVVQFRDVKVVARTRVPTPAGVAIRIRTSKYPHHTAIVSAVSPRALKVLHQNIASGGATDDKQVVREDTLRLDGLRAGTLWVYRPVAEGEAVGEPGAGREASSQSMAGGSR